MNSDEALASGLRAWADGTKSLQDLLAKALVENTKLRAALKEAERRAKG